MRLVRALIYKDELRSTKATATLKLRYVVSKNLLYFDGTKLNRAGEIAYTSIRRPNYLVVTKPLDTLIKREVLKGYNLLLPYF